MECTDKVSLADINSPESSIHPDCWKIHVDGSAAEANRGVSLAITSPKGSKIFYALKYTFLISNNESEYEAVLAGLRVVRTLHIQKLHIFTDSQLIVDHINGKFEVKEENMQKYLQLVLSFQNTEAYALSKLRTGDALDGTMIEPLTQISIDNLPVLTLTQKTSWMMPIIQYISVGTCLSDKVQAQ